MNCSSCGKTLESQGLRDIFPSASIGGVGSPSDYDMWKAQACRHCKLVLCGDCIRLGEPTPCPECGAPTEPAYKKIVAAMGAIRQLTKSTDKNAPGKQAPAGGTNLTEVTDQNFEAEVINSAVPVLVDFWAPWCGPCLRMNPAVEEIAKDYQGRVKVAKLNVDENGETAARYGIKSIPTMLLFQRGAIAQQIVGAQSKQNIAKIIEKHLQ
jgi:thioredoxin 1